MFQDADIIYSYTRKEAIEDGCQIKLEGEYADLAKEAGFKYPVYLTSGVLGLIDQAVQNKKHCNDFTDVLWDILYIASRSPGKMINDRTKEFEVIITGTGRTKYHTMYIECGPQDIDDPTPVLTVMLPSEN